MFFLFTLIVMKGNSQSLPFNLTYSALSLADSLTEGADAVYRVDEGSLEVLSTSKYIYRIHNVVTVLNKKGERFFSHSVMVDKQIKLENIFINIYDSLGRKVSTYTKKDFASRSADDGMSIFTDDKILYLTTVHPQYPCTVETSYEIVTSSYLSLPGWSFTSGRASVERSLFTVKVPTDPDIRHRTHGINVEPVITTNGETKTYVWQAKNIKAATTAEDNTFENINTASITILPNRFVYEGYPGQMKTWKEFGDWNYPLYTDEKGFNARQLFEIEVLLANCKTPKQKIEALYNHLKNTMRYVSVQLGIGGQKPFPIQYVYEKKYGDCKALTNYMRYLLKAANINSYPALVNAGSYKAPIDPLYAAPYFNHVILCVPIANDTMWLECTSKNNQAGVLGSFTENKNVLLLTENGGKMVSTPKSKSANNQLNTQTIIQLNENGGAAVTSNLQCTGDFWNLFYQVEQFDSETKKRLFSQYLHYKIPDEFLLKQVIDTALSTAFTLNLVYDKLYSFKAGFKYFYDLHINKIVAENFGDSTRKHDYVFDYPYEKTDTTLYILPEGTTVESTPAKKEINTAYLHYSSECLPTTGDNRLCIVTKLTIKEKVVPAAAYRQLADGLAMAIRNEDHKIVLKKI